MGRICWKMTACIGLVVFSQTASAALNDHVPMIAGHSAYRDVSQPARPAIGLLAQTAEPAVSAAAPAPDSKAPHDPPAPAVSSPNPTSTAAVTRAGPTATGCGLKYLAAELAGKLKGRKWKEFREQECGPITTNAVFPSAVAPKYSGESPDKARTLTCADQFSANKAANANDGMKWIEKGGGYYSECVSRLKG
jgi:hypothetical protein